VSAKQASHTDIEPQYVARDAMDASGSAMYDIAPGGADGNDGPAPRPAMEEGKGQVLVRPYLLQGVEQMAYQHPVTDGPALDNTSGREKNQFVASSNRDKQRPVSVYNGFGEPEKAFVASSSGNQRKASVYTGFIEEAEPAFDGQLSRANSESYTEAISRSVSGGGTDGYQAPPPPKCIQKTAKGTQCTNAAAAGATRCTDHTCQFAGCTTSKSSKVQYCKKHISTPITLAAKPHTVVNASFMGIVLDSLKGWDDGSTSSTTDAIAVAPAAAAPPPSTTTPPPFATSKLDKFVAPVMVLGDNTLAAKGLTAIMGVDPRTYRDLTGQRAINKIIAEFKKSGTHWAGDEQSDQQTIAGLINGSYCNPGTSTQLLSLEELMSTIELVRLKKHGLNNHHVLAIRIYTTTCYRSINSPMRKKPHAQLPHPFAATMYYITTGLKILRAAQGEDTVNASKEQCFYRGLRDLQISSKFTEMGGTEMSCMSTTFDINVAAAFASGSMSPLLFRYRSNDFMSSGACIWFISVYPEEKEVLYPPLTYLSCPTAGSRTEVVINGRTFPVVEVRPTYPET
jgi:hypothetical protein